MDITQFSLRRPEKVVWRFPEAAAENILAGIKSKGLRKFLQKIDQILQDQHIRYEYRQEVTHEEFELWLQYYKQKMIENKYDVIASTDWYEKKVGTGSRVEGIFFYQNDQLVGSGILANNLQGKGVFAFKASDKINLTNDSNSSIGAAVDYFFLKEMSQQGVKIISAGRSRNAFGVINSFGYLDYKLRFGYEPLIQETESLVGEVPLNENGVVIFYGYRGEKMTLFALKPKGYEITFEVARFATPELPFELIEY